MGRASLVPYLPSDFDQPLKLSVDLAQELNHLQGCQDEEDQGAPVPRIAHQPLLGRRTTRFLETTITAA
jgi:hypothetical protein